MTERVLIQTDEIGPFHPEEVAVRKRSAVSILGWIEILTGLGICVLETTTLILYHHSGAPGYPTQYAGIWTGVFAILTGIVQVLAGKKVITLKTRRTMFLAGMGTTIVCILQAIVMFSMSMYNIYLVRMEIARRENPQHHPINFLDSPLTVDQLKDLAMLMSVLALIYFCLVVFAFISTILDGLNVCGSRRIQLPADQRVYASVDGTQVKQIKIYNKAQQ